MTAPAISADAPDFSLVLGGPLYQLFRHTRLSGDALELLRRRVIVLSCIAWLPLLALAALAGQLLDATRGLSFLYDIEVHVRFLVALPILIAAERVVHLRIRPEIPQFVERRIVALEDVPRFHDAIRATLRWRNSVAAEVVMLALVYTLGLLLSEAQLALSPATWFAAPDATGMRLTQAGYWYMFVSLPLFQFVLLRWYFRFCLWFLFLWRVSRLRLHLVPSHPDRVGGLAFLGVLLDAFTPILFAQSSLLAALIASQTLHAHRDLMSFQGQAAGFLAFSVAVFLSPLAVFTPALASVKRHALRDFGGLGSRYAAEFEAKWVHGDGPANESLLQSNIQSLADVRASCSVAQDMRYVPFVWQDVAWLAAGAAAPLLPLALMVVSVEELVRKLIAVLV